MTLAEHLAQGVPGLPLSESPVDKLSYARDLWPRHHLDVRSGRMLESSRPAVIVWPRTTEEVAAIVRLCAKEGVPVVPFGAGSGVCAGVLPHAGMVVIDMKRMTRWRSLDADVPSLDVEAGAMGITLEEQLQRRGCTIGHFPSSILCSTVGGWLAARGAGQCSGLYGKIEDMVAAIEMVDGLGDIIQLKRRVHGPDLTPLVIGSEGTMGVITSATLRLHSNPSVRAYSAFSFPDVEAGWTAIRELFQAGLRPAVARLYDPFDSFMARQGSVKGEGPPKKIARPGRGAAALSRILRSPRLLNGAIDALGSRTFGGSTLVLIFEGEGDAPHADSARAAQLCAAGAGTPLGEGPARKWFQHRYSVSYRQAPIFRMGAFSDTMEVAAPWSRLRALYDGVRKALGKHVFVMAHLSHAYPDGCSIYFTFAGSAATDEACAARYDEAWKAALVAAIEAGGTLSHHHGVGRSKAPRLASELGAGVGLVRDAMRAFDPHGIMNPGSLLPTDDVQDAVSPPTPPAAFAIDVESRLATLPGDMTLTEVSRRLLTSGLELPGAPPTTQGLTVNEWIAGGLRGAPRPWADPVDHVVAGLRADLPSGTRLALGPAPRRAVGPDLIALFVGTAGKFGRVTSADVRIRKVTDLPARELTYRGVDDPPIDASEARLLARMGGG